MASRLKYVVIDPEDGTVTNLIVERGRLLRRDIVVPAAWVEEGWEGEIVGNAVALNLWKPDRPGVPIYEAARSDDEILADFQANLREVPALSEVRVQVDRGMVHLSGAVPTPDDKATSPRKWS
jgi:hypothetical protein